MLEDKLIFDYSSTLTGAFLMPPRGSNERFAH